MSLVCSLILLILPSQEQDLSIRYTAHDCDKQLNCISLQIATPGARRPMSRVERARIEHARDRLTRRGARPPFFDPPPHVEASMPEEFARFCGENVLIFNTVERAPRRVKDINEAISQVRYLSTSKKR